MSKPKVIKEFGALDDAVKQAIYELYPYGFERHLITFKNHKKHLISALPFETEDRFYMVKMTRGEANKISSQKTVFEASLEGIEEISEMDEKVVTEKVDAKKTKKKKAKTKK